MKSCNQPACACMWRWEMSHEHLCDWTTILCSQPKIFRWLKSKVLEILRIQQCFWMNGWTCVVGSMIFMPLQGMWDIYFAYSSWAWVYKAFKSEVSCMFSYDGSVREHEICENVLVMPLWICQAAKAMLVVWRKKALNRRISVQEKHFH